MHGCTNIRLQGRQRRAGPFQLRPGAHRVELRAATGIDPGGDNIQGLGLNRHILLGHLQPLLQATQFKIAAGHLSGQCHLQGTEISPHRLQLRRLGLGGPAQTAKHIQLPLRRDAGLVQFYPLRPTADRRALHIRQMLLGTAGTGRDAGPLLPLGTVQQGRGPIVTGQRRLQRLVRCQGLCDQLRQQGIIKALPEVLLGLGKITRGGRGGRAGMWRRKAVRFRGLRHLIIRPDCTPGQQGQPTNKAHCITHGCLLESVHGRPLPGCFHGD